MNADNGSPELPSKAPARAGGIDRRTIVKGAAWSLPVIAIAVGAPAQAASGDTWNIKLAGGCLVGVAGVGLLPGYSIKETLNHTPTVNPLTFIETFTTTIPISWVGGLGHVVSRTAALTLAATTYATVGTLFLLVGSIGGKSGNVSIGSFPSAIGATGSETVLTGTTTGAGTSIITYTATRTVSVSSMVAGSTVGYAYIAGLSLSTITVPGLTIGSQLTATGGSGGKSSGDDTAALTQNILIGHC